MGFSSWKSLDWSSYKTTTSTKSMGEIFIHFRLHPDLDPLKIDKRESRDSATHPLSTPMIVGADVTGSMGILAENIVKSGLGMIMEELLKRKPISDPHLMIMAIGDMNYDSSPLQVTQFETDMAIAAQIEKIHVEGGGGNNDSESYIAPWYFAAMKTQTDAFQKRRKKGYLFTLGDETCPSDLSVDQIRRFIGDTPQSPYSAQELLNLVSQTYHVFHIIIEQGSFAKSHPDRVTQSWRKILGQRAVQLSDYTKLAEVIVSIIQVNEGSTRDDVVASWDGSTALVVKKSLGNLVGVRGSGSAVVRFS